MLDLQLLSALHCLKWQQAISPAALQLLQKLSAPAVTHIKSVLPRSPSHPSSSNLPLAVAGGTAVEEGR